MTLRIAPKPHVVERVASAALHAIRPGWARSDPSFSLTVAWTRRHERWASQLSDELLLVEADLVRARLGRQGLTRRNLAVAFALGREASFRSMGFRQHPVQIAGANAMVHGRLIEMATGEGKTATAALAAAVGALCGIQVHVVTVNDYLAERDAHELGAVYSRLGLSVGVVTETADQKAKFQAYQYDIVYLTSKVLVFDHLRDRLTFRGNISRSRTSVLRHVFGTGRTTEPLIRMLGFAIIDEADSLLIDEARTPLIISGPAPDMGLGQAAAAALTVARTLISGQDFVVDMAARRITLTDQGKARMSDAARSLPDNWRSRAARDELIEQALVAIHLFARGQQYIVEDGKVQIVDEFTGRVMPDRKWQQGLHQLIELKEGCDLSDARTTLTQMTFQRFFRSYLWCCGMTGTATGVARELTRTYGLKVVALPTHRTPRRKSLGVRLTRSSPDKWQAIIASIKRCQARGQPVLVGTRSVEASEELAVALSKAGLSHKLINARENTEEAEIIASAGHTGAITIATNMAGRGTDIKPDEAARKAGGLHVILSEFHESARIDRQLFGRAGRQGDPGSCEAIVALDDDLFTRYAPRSTRFVASCVAYLPFRAPSWPARLLRLLAQNSAEVQAQRTRAQTIKNDEHYQRGLSFAAPE